MGWTGARWQPFNNYPELLLSEYAIKVYGQGHVIAYNKVTNFHDAIDMATFGVPDGVTLPDGSSANGRSGGPFPAIGRLHRQTTSAIWATIALRWMAAGATCSAIANHCCQSGGTGLQRTARFRWAVLLGPQCRLQHQQCAQIYREFRRHSHLQQHFQSAKAAAGSAQNMHFPQQICLSVRAITPTLFCGDLAGQHQQRRL